jgi:spermidine synthase
MGTSFRSSVSWGVPTTVVDLIPSVPALFPYFHADASACCRAPGARVVVDDGRRFLERSVEQFDVVTIDPPPPVEAAGSSLLYSRRVLRRDQAPPRARGHRAAVVPGGDPRS